VQGTVLLVKKIQLLASCTWWHHSRPASKFLHHFSTGILQASSRVYSTGSRQNSNSW